MYHSNSASHDLHHMASHPYYQAMYAGSGTNHRAGHYDTHSFAQIQASVGSPVGWRYGIDPVPIGWKAGPWTGTIVNDLGQIYHSHTLGHEQYHAGLHDYYNNLYGGHHHRNGRNYSNY